ncbi:substrate-binding periplasmic protein [Salidesulfovibrio onnuriiensis]|uniref:substrate-binding periplasmic protein n=1 Tax=Salidesulfovibrio onnuriiensis TaxID=2583823 RepID=UPI0016502023|nr:transporter substrate-binding domain-containing protein [Salidesulfovibrio onnuriiensis]
MRVIVVAVVCLMWAFPVFGGGLLVVTEEMVPYNFRQDGQVVGLSTELVRRTLEKSGLEGRFQVMPWARAYYIARNDPNVLIYTIVRTEEREKLFKWIGPVAPAVDEKMYCLRSRPDVVVRTLDDARNYKVAVVRDGVGHRFLEEQGFSLGINLDLSPNEDQMFAKLFWGRVDIVISDDLNNAWKLPAIDRNARELQPLITLRNHKLYMACGPATPDETVDRLRKGLAAVSAEEKRRILQKYRHPAWACDPLPY